MDWKLVRHSRTRKEIGALGFIDNKIAIVATFYEDKDWDHDGKVSLKEKFGSVFGLKGKAVAEVLTQAMSDPDLLIKDPSLRQMHGNAIVQFASGMIKEGMYIIFFKRAIGQSCGVLAGSLASSSAARFIIRKGMEQAVKKAYMESIH